MAKTTGIYRVIVCLLILSVIMIGCIRKSEDMSAWKKSGILRIGTDATYPPFEMVNVQSGHPEGFDIDIMNAVCRINGWTPEFIITPFDGIISGLKSGKYDCIVSAMSITPEREAVVSFTRPYYLAGQVVAVPLADTLIKSVDDLEGHKVGVQLGTTGERMAGGLPDVEVFSFDNIGAAFIDMENAHLDAVLNDMPTTMEYIRLKGKAKIVGDLLSKEYYGIAVRKEDSELRGRIDSALAVLENNGDYDLIMKKWFHSINAGESRDLSDSLVGQKAVDL